MTLTSNAPNQHFPDRAEGFWDGYRDPMADSPWLARWSLGWFIGRRVRLFELTRPFRYVMANCDVITVPAGYRTDGASIPQRLQDIFPPFGAWVEAAIIHDYLCTRGLQRRGVVVSRPHVGPRSRRFTDRETHALWGEMLTQVPAANLITPWQRSRMSWAVQTFGPRWTFHN